METNPNDFFNGGGASVQIETKPLFRADTDQHGDWYVWRRLGENGWATMRRCDSQTIAEQLASTLNAGEIVAE